MNSKALRRMKVPQMSDTLPAIVIGAGPAGLAAGSALLAAGVPFLVLEKEARVAMTWRRRHPQLRMNTHRHYSRLGDTPFPAGSGSFAPRDTVVAYLETVHEKLAPFLRLGVAVTALGREGDLWIVSTTQGPFRARNVIIATGRDAVPYIPDMDGLADFRKPVLHSAQFGSLSQYVGKRILVVGAGNSGFDILNHLATIATKSVWLSVRSGPALLPRRLGGVAVHRFAGLLSLLPARVADIAILAAQRIAFGDLSSLGFPPPPAGGATRLKEETIAIAVDDGAVAAMKQGRIVPVGPVARFEEDRVVLADDTEIEPDVVIFATGYRTGLETLAGQLDVLDRDGLPLINGAQQAPGCEGLWFIGMRPVLQGDFYASNRQAIAVAEAIRGQEKTRESARPPA